MKTYCYQINSIIKTQNIHWYKTTTFYIYLYKHTHVRKYINKNHTRIYPHIHKHNKYNKTSIKTVALKQWNNFLNFKQFKTKSFIYKLDFFFLKFQHCKLWTLSINFLKNKSFSLSTILASVIRNLVIVFTSVLMESTTSIFNS